MLRTTYRPEAVVLLPVAVDASIRDAPAIRRWLARGAARAEAAGPEPLPRVLEALGRPAIREGLAALRQWGQTGERPDVWLCGADPVYLEPRLDHLCLFTLNDLEDAALASLMGELQRQLATGREYAFSCVGSCGYFESAEPVATARVSAATAHGEPIERLLPEGSRAAAHDRLQSELQMCLHALDFNRTREAEGKLPVNALWFWGGGEAPAEEQIRGALPALFCDDALVAGYWLAAGGRCRPWPGSLVRCLEAASGAFVAIVPRAEAAVDELESLRKLLSRGDIGELTLLFADGLRIDLKRSDRLRFWRRALAVPEDHRAQ